MSYLYEKLYVTIDILSSGKGDVRSRLEGAYISALGRLDINDIPEKYRRDWERYIGRLTKYPPEYLKNDSTYMTYSSLENSLRRMKNKTGEKIAKFLFELFIYESNRIYEI